ncbi:hypothetical protein KKF91_19550 [Myxococcota bacterium]|nr:hypothetical protein [Myxococcota bacterium]MBU1432740.1 hypothetical protein [Myxococcota bacterium]MBU1898086.1 hypothetical protein [Myxococcota bacterium]
MTRRAFEIFYWAMAIGLGVSVSLSTTYHVFKAPEASKAVEHMPAEICGRRLDALYKALNEEASAVLTDTQRGPEKLKAWTAFSGPWRQDLRALRVRCGARPLQLKISDLERVHLSLSTAIKSFVDLSKPSLDRLGHPATAPATIPTPAQDAALTP